MACWRGARLESFSTAAGSGVPWRMAIRRVFAEFEHALVEGEPRELAVDVAVDGQRAVVLAHARTLVVVLVERVGRGVLEVLGVHRPIVTGGV